MMTKSTVRETPAPEPLQCGLTDPSRPDVGPNSRRPEPVLAIDQIQGNIVPGFSKDFQTLLFLRIDHRREFKDWLRSQIPFIANAAEVLAFNRLFKEIRARRKQETHAVRATWLNIAFTFHGLEKLTDDAHSFSDSSFKVGLAARSQALGDPADEDNLPGSPKNWVIGNQRNTPDVVLIIAADLQWDMRDEVEWLEESLNDFRTAEGHLAVRVLFKEEGANLPSPLSGHEHFGFLDGVSQPGLRGRISNDPHDVLTLRQHPLKRDQVNAEGKIVSAQGKPGQDLLWPGEFVLGYQKQNPAENDQFDGPNGEPLPLKPDNPDGTVSLQGVAPEWARNGSFLVFRRLRQDVFAFHRFLREQADQLGVPTTPHASGPRMVGSSLVGRWPSGAPVERLPDDDDRNLADSDCANNNFEFRDATDPLPAANPQQDPFACTDDNPNPPPAQFPPGAEDKEGQRLPFTGHIRKAYPRDDKSDKVNNDVPDVPGCKARSHLNESNTQTHRILRRGIPFGEISPSTPEVPTQDNVERGLHFLAYQSSIVNQFEFILRCWVNNPDFKEPFQPMDVQAGGHDPIIGQNNKTGEERRRQFTIAFTDATGARQLRRATTQTDWVIPTGGGYFFAPSIAALGDPLSK
jgi:Dyp-type peroxidase family